MLLLHILLGILKFVGILLLAVFILLLLLLLALLFAPFRYRFTIVRTEEDTAVGASVSWLLHFISFRFSLHFPEMEKKWEVRILGMNPLSLRRWFGRNKGQKSGASGKSGRNRMKSGWSSEETEREYSKDNSESPGRDFSWDNPEDEDGQSAAGDAGAEEFSDIGQEARGEKPSESALPEDGPSSGSEDDEGAADGRDFSRDGTLSERFRNFVYKTVSHCTKIFSDGTGRIRTLLARVKQIPAKAKAILRKIGRLLQKPGELLEKANRIRQMLEKYEAAEVVSHVLKECKGLLRHFRIRRGRGFLHFGVGDPAATGELTGLLYCILPAGCGEIEIRPEFNEAVFSADLDLKGHVRLIHLAASAVRLFFDRRLRNLLGAIRHHRNAGR